MFGICSAMCIIGLKKKVTFTVFVSRWSQELILLQKSLILFKVNRNSKVLNTFVVVYFTLPTKNRVNTNMKHLRGILILKRIVLKITFAKGMSDAFKCKHYIFYIQYALSFRLINFEFLNRSGNRKRITLPLHIARLLSIHCPFSSRNFQNIPKKNGNGEVLTDCYSLRVLTVNIQRLVVIETSRYLFEIMIIIVSLYHLETSYYFVGRNKSRIMR